MQCQHLERDHDRRTKLRRGKTEKMGARFGARYTAAKVVGKARVCNLADLTAIPYAWRLHQQRAKGCGGRQLSALRLGRRCLQGLVGEGASKSSNVGEPVAVVHTGALHAARGHGGRRGHRPPQHHGHVGKVCVIRVDCGHVGLECVSKEDGVGVGARARRPVQAAAVAPPPLFDEKGLVAGSGNPVICCLQE